MKARRMSCRYQLWLRYDEHDHRYSFPDVGHPRFAEAQHRARYGTPTPGDVLLLADAVMALHYLTHGNPTTKGAAKQLAEVRAAIRALPITDEETDR